MAEQTQSFKRYERGSRVLLTENIYNKGMAPTNKPLMEGFCNTLINMDIVDMGESLQPRPGLRTTDYILLGNTSDVPLQLIDGIVYHSSENNNAFAHIMLGPEEATPIVDSSILKGKLYSVTNNLKTNGVITTECLEEDEYTYYTQPNEAEIHNIKIDVNSNMLRHIGCFAYNKDYYYFKESKELDIYSGDITTNVYLCQDKFDSETNTFKSNIVVPRATAPKEAVMWGYNMLSNTPYAFEDTLKNTGGAIALLGLLPYKDTLHNEIELTPVVNQTVYLRCYYDATPSTTYKAQWFWRGDNNDTFIELTDKYTFSDGELKATFSAPTKYAQIKIIITKNDETDMVLQVMTVGIDFDKEAHKNKLNSKPINYDLSKCQGMAHWRNRLVVYGLHEDATVLLLSEVNDPSYFPYPTNVVLFEDPIIHVEPVLDNLLVFTKTSLHMVVQQPDGLTFITNTIQRNLNINTWDVHLIQAVKNMVFFKSGNYYYMVVPSLKSITGELVIAPISKNIERFLDNFKENIVNTLNMLYDYNKELKLIHYYNYLDYEDINNTYVFQTEDGTLINVCLLYNSVSRHWRLYIYESESINVPIIKDATKHGTLMNLTELDNELCIQYLNYDKVNLTDYYISKLGKNIKYQNYQVLDTGYREHNSIKKKRYREIQFNIQNADYKNLEFYTEFYIDGSARKTMFKYNTSVVNGESGFAEVVISKELINPALIPSATILGSEDDLNCWTLDTSEFPEISLWKIRIPTSGKGYAPRFVLYSKNLANFQLLSNSYVYRELYAR